MRLVQSFDFKMIQQGDCHRTDPVSQRAKDAVAAGLFEMGSIRWWRDRQFIYIGSGYLLAVIEVLHSAGFTAEVIK